jgi:hypothetical protein
MVRLTPYLSLRHFFAATKAASKLIFTFEGGQKCFKTINFALLVRIRN